MSYLLDKKNQRKRFTNYALFAFLLIVIFYFRTPVFNFLSSAAHVVFRPVLVLKNSFGGALSSIGTAFSFKSSLVKENEDLRQKLAENNALILNYDSVLDENNKIKETLGRKNDKTNMLLGVILSKPNQSPYDTLIIDVGANNGVVVGDLVFALGNVPIGQIFEVYASSAKVVLFSNSGEKTEVVVGIKDAFIEMVGRGGGNFEMILPRDFVLEVGSNVTLPGITPYVVAKVETIISDPRDSFAKAILSSPINIEELKFVEVRK